MPRMPHFHIDAYAWSPGITSGHVYLFTMSIFKLKSGFLNLYELYF